MPAQAEEGGYSENLALVLLLPLSLVEMLAIVCCRMDTTTLGCGNAVVVDVSESTCASAVTDASMVAATSVVDAVTIVTTKRV